MTDFKVFKAKSDELFLNGEVNPRLIVEEGCWYLCTDTAELFVGVSSDTGLTLKRINDSELHQIPASTLALKSDLESAKQEVIQTVTPEVNEVKTKVETVLIPKVEDEIVPTISEVKSITEELKAWVENKEFLQHIDLDNYITQEKVTEIITEEVVTVVDNKVEDRVIEVIQEKVNTGEVTVVANSISYSDF